MRKSVFIVIVAGISAMSALLVAERQYSSGVEASLRYAAPDEAALQSLSADGTTEQTATAEVK